MQAFDHSAPMRSREGVKRLLIVGCAVAAVAVVLMAFLLPAGRGSVMALANALFTASEQANSYLYQHLPTPAGADPTIALALACVLCADLTLLAFLTPGAALPLTLAVALALGQAYFGLSLPPAANIGAFALLALAALCDRLDRRACLAFCGCVAAVTLTAALLLPGTNAAIEDASERVRDWLGASVQAVEGGGTELASGLTPTRHENQRAFNGGNGASQTGDEYHLVNVAEQQIALPHWVDYLRIALLCLLIPAVLAVPFLPFLWLNSRSRRAAERLACIDAEDNAQAIAGMFALVIGYLDAAHAGDENALYLRRLDTPDPRLDADYAALYMHCAQLWQEAVYSGRPMPDEAREPVLRLLEQTERIFYDGADLRTRLRLRYIHCLHE